MPDNTNQPNTDPNSEIMAGVLEQIKDLQPDIEKKLEIDAVLEELNNLNNLIGGSPNDQINNILATAINKVSQIQSGAKSQSDFGPVLGDLDTLSKLIDVNTDDTNKKILSSVIAQIKKLLNYRPDVQAVLGDIEAIKLKGGPADATAFHDFHVLQIAFENIWLQLFDKKLRSQAEQLYEDAVRLYDDAGMEAPDFESIADIYQLGEFIGTVKSLTGEGGAPPPANVPPLTPEVLAAFPEVQLFWAYLSDQQRDAIRQQVSIVNDADASRGDKEQARKTVVAILEARESAAGRLTRLIVKLGEALSEPYAFDIFAPNSYNFGIMLTYRQKWEPGEYQAGDLKATIPLAPGETRKYTKKQIVKKVRAEKEIEKSMSSRSEQLSETSRAEAEIMQKATTATNFKMTAHGSFNIAIGSIDSTSEFALNQVLESTTNKKNFHEATVKAAQEYRLERSVEIDTTSSVETEETTSGEISNPNNEITVTYLFYELQRRYNISEQIYRARPVILVAQDVPAPHEIDEAWLIKYQWILSRVLLDDSFRLALTYLTSGMAGDEVSMEVIKAHWKAQKSLTESLESQVKSQLAMRDSLREVLVQTALGKSMAEIAQMPLAAKILTLGLAPDPSSAASDALEANRKAAETRLQYVEQALADAQNKLIQATDSYEKATQQYAAALQQQYNRHVAIDQLRVHVKQNILYYAQAIWDHEPPDQRFFRLYNLEIFCPGYDKDLVDITIPKKSQGQPGDPRIKIKDPHLALPSDKVLLKDIADLDDLIGYKGNYMIFPLKRPLLLTTHMLQEFIDEYAGIRDPDGSTDFDIEKFDDSWKNAKDDKERAELKKELLNYLTVARRTTGEIIVPTGQLFIEALPGSHPLLEDFKLLHRAEDVRKVKAEVRHAELENLRLASRLVAGQKDSKLLEDPDIEKKIIVEGNASVDVNGNS
jgi:hypothetical protein